jgi:hypothetical protein
MRILVWKWKDGDWHPEQLTGLFRIGCAAALMSIDPVRADAIAVVVVAEAGSNIVGVRGSLLPAGISALRDRDKIDLIGETYWVSAECSPREEIYDPLRHGSDVRCFMTKARLRAGEPITVCVGTATAPCGTVYRQRAWADLLTRPGFRCPNCSYDPRAELWKPPVPLERPLPFSQALRAMQEARQ